MSSQSVSQLVLLMLATCLAGLGSGCTAGGNKANHLNRADQYYEEGKYSEAEIEYLNVLKLDPASPHAIAQLGLIYYEQGRLGRAYPFIFKAHEMDPTDLNLRIKAAQLSLMTGDANAARESVETALARSPTNSELPMLLAECIRTRDDAQEIQQKLGELREQIGDTAPVTLAMGVIEMRLNDLEAAEASIKRALEADPGFAAAHSALGTLYWAQNNLTNAEAHFRTAAELSPQRSPRRLRYADFKLKTGDVEEAKGMLADLTRNAPDYLPAWTSLGEIALTQNDLTNCSSLVTRALATDANDYTALLLRARLRLAQRDAEKAVAELEQMSAAYERSPQVLYFLAAAYLLNDNFAEALKSINRAVALNPAYEDALLLQADLNIRRGQPDSAIASLSPLVQRRHAGAAPYLLLIRAHVAKGTLNEALANCRRLGELFPTNAQIPLLTGNVLLQQQRKDEARKEFERAMELSPEALAPFEQLVNLDIADNRPEVAMQRITEKIEQWPRSPVLPILMAKVHSSQNETNKAEAALLKAIELEPGYQAAHMLLARLYMSSKQNEKALERLKLAVEKNPSDVAALLLIGILQTEQQDFAEARATYEKLVAGNPNFSPGWNNLAYLCSEKMGDSERAYEAARRARALAPANPYCADTLGWIVFKRGDYQTAFSLLQESVERLPAEPEVQFHLGMASYMLANQERARSAFAQALETASASGKEFPGIEEARRRLAVIEIDTRSASAEAVGKLEGLVSEQPNDPIALSKLAEIYRLQGNAEKAISSYEKVLQHSSRNARAMARLSVLYNEANENEKALNLAKEAYKAAPDDEEVSYVLGRQVFATGDHRWALSLFQQAVQRGTPTADLFYDLAMAQYSIGRVVDAEANFRRAQSSDASFGRADKARQNLDLISAAATPASASAAETQAKQVLQSEPGSVPALMVVALSAEHNGDAEVAIQTYDQILRRFPEFLPAVRNLAILEASRSTPGPRAYDLSLKARQAFPDDPLLALALGKSLYHRGDFRGALRLLNEAIQKGATNGESYYYLGMTQYNLSSAAAAAEALRRSLSLNLPQALSDEARRVLTQLSQ